MLWEGVTGPKGSTKKRARGKRRVTRPKIDLNKGQQVGRNILGVQWPLLAKPLNATDDVRNVQVGDVDTTYFEKLNEFRNKSSVKRKRVKLSPIERGWSGARMGGQSVGSPDPNFPEFDSRILELKTVSTMKASKGRFRRFSVIVGTGNGRGILGVGTAKSQNMRAAIKRAKDRAFKNLVYYDLKEGRTLYHLGHTKMWHSSIFAFPKPEGHGLVCHRLLATLCRIVGLKDLYAKVEGNQRNYRVLVQAFMQMLREQQNYQAIANRTGLHVVEFSQDRDLYPRVLASPEQGAVNTVAEVAPAFNTIQSIDSESIPESKEVKKPLVHPSERSIIMRNKPRQRHIFQKPVANPTFIDDLVAQTDNNSAESMTALLSEGERDLDTLLVLRGLVLKIKPNEKPFYWQLEPVKKRRREKYRYRNQEAAARERRMYKYFENEQHL